MQCAVTHHASGSVTQRAPAMWLGSEKFVAEEVVSVAFQFNAYGMPALDVALSDGASARLAAETTRQKGQVVALRLDDRVIERPLVAEAVTGGKLQIARGRTVPEIKALIHDIACTMALPRNIVSGSTDEKRRCD